LASKNQYDVFKALYDDESARYKDLMDRAKTYISIITLLSGILVFKADELKVFLSASPFVRWTFVAGAALFILALLALLLGMRIRNYDAFADPSAVVDQYPEDAVMTDEEFFDNRIGELSLATTDNAGAHDALASGLAFSSWFLVLATSFTLLSVIGRLIR
jgi:hypothetical protein